MKKLRSSIIRIPTKPKELRECINATNNTAGDTFIPTKKDVQRWAVYPAGKSLGAKVFLEDGNGYRFRESRVTNLMGRQEFTLENSVNAKRYDFDDRRELVSEEGILIIKKKDNIVNNDLDSIEKLKNTNDNNQDNPHGVLRSILRKNTNGNPNGASIINGNPNGAIKENTNGNPNGAIKVNTNGNPNGAININDNLTESLI